MIEKFELFNMDTNYKILVGDSSEYDYIIPQGGIVIDPLEADHSAFNFPGQIGSTVSYTNVGPRGIHIVGYIIGQNIMEIERKKQTLSKFFNVFQTIAIRSGNYSIYGRPSSNVKYGSEYADNNDVLVKFLIDLFCTKPMWEKSNGDSISVALLKPAFKFPLLMLPKKKNGGIIFGKRKKELFSQIINDGPVGIGIDVMVKSTGVVNNPEIRFVEENVYLRIKKTLQEGEQVHISTLVGERVIEGRMGEGSDYISYLDYWDETSTWLTLPVGITTVAFKTRTNGIEDDTYKNVDIIIEYKKCLFNLDGE